MKNFRPKVEKLSEQQVEKLNDMGFQSPRIGASSVPITEQDSYFEKSYGFCGCSFKLCIRINTYPFGSSYCEKFVKMESPHICWHQKWDVKQFWKEMGDSRKEFYGDIVSLINAGIIEEDEDDD